MADYIQQGHNKASAQSRDLKKVPRAVGSQNLDTVSVAVGARASGILSLYKLGFVESGRLTLSLPNSVWRQNWGRELVSSPRPDILLSAEKSS